MRKFLRGLLGVVEREAPVFNMAKAEAAFCRITGNGFGEETQRAMGQGVMIGLDLVDAEVCHLQECENEITNLSQKAEDTEAIHQAEKTELEGEIEKLLAQVEMNKMTIRAAAAKMTKKMGQLNTRKEEVQSVKDFFQALADPVTA